MNLGESSVQTNLNNSKQSKTLKQEIFKQIPNKYTNIILPEPDLCGIEPNKDYKICTHQFGTSNSSSLLQLKFNSDPRINGRNVPFAFQFYSPNNLPKERVKCENGFG